MKWECQLATHIMRLDATGFFFVGLCGKKNLREVVVAIWQILSPRMIVVKIILPAAINNVHIWYKIFFYL